MSKIIGLTFLVALIGTSVVAWSRSTGHESRQNDLSNPSLVFSPEEIHRRATAGSMPVEKVHDQTFVYSDGD